MYPEYRLWPSERAVRQYCAFGKDPDLLRLAGIPLQPWHSLPVSSYLHCLCPALNQAPVAQDYFLR